MQTYGLKIGDKVKLSQNAGTHPQGYIFPDMLRKERISVKAWKGPIRIEKFEFIDGATYIKLELNCYLIATEVEKIKEKPIESVKVGDWITIINSRSNWNSAMDKYAGNTYKVTKVIKAKDYSSISIKFDGSGCWNWTIRDNHFRFATEEEISRPNRVVIKFDKTDLTIVKGSGKATCIEGTITLKDIEAIIDSVKYPDKMLLNYPVVFTIPDNTIMQIGCQKDTLAKVKEIYKAMGGV